MKKQLGLAVTFLAGLAMIISYFVPHKMYAPVEKVLSSWVVIVTGFALGLGIFSLARVHINKLRKVDGENKFYSLVTLVSMVVMAFVGFAFGQKEGPFKVLYDNVFVPLDATMFSLLAFYISSAAFRAFRMKSLESGLLLVAAVIVMLGRVPVGQYVSEYIPIVSDFILEFPNNAGKRAIMIGVALGVASTALKIMLGIERSYMGGK